MQNHSGSKNSGNSGHGELRVKHNLKIRRALFTVSDKHGVVELAQAMADTGTEIVATGRTASVLREAGISIVPIEKISGSPEAFQGRMKTLSFPVCSGLLYRRGDSSDEADMKRLGISPIDAVIVNFYPFELAAERAGITRKELVEEIDIGGPTLVRAAAKNAPDVLVVTSPEQYASVIRDLKSQGAVSSSVVEQCAAQTWDRILAYDAAIASEFGAARKQYRALRYGENPHQKGVLEFDPSGPIGWGESLTPNELSYNNILDLSAAYGLANDLIELDPNSSGVVIIKHNNPCGVALVPKQGRTADEAQKLAFLRAWEGDPVSAFGGVLVFTDPVTREVAELLAGRFVELIAAPGLDRGLLETILIKRKNLKAVPIHRFTKGTDVGNNLKAYGSSVSVPGGSLIQTQDVGLDPVEGFKTVTKVAWPERKIPLARFGSAVCRTLKSNAIAIVREIPEIPGAYQLVGAGQGQPNRIEALQALAIPRARNILDQQASQPLAECLMISDAFFPFRDTVDAAHEAGIKFIVQPGGSIKDAESIAAADSHGISMVFTGRRHFRH